MRSTIMSSKEAFDEFKKHRDQTAKLIKRLTKERDLLTLKLADADKRVVEASVATATLQEQVTTLNKQKAQLSALCQTLHAKMKEMRPAEEAGGAAADGGAAAADGGEAAAAE